MLAKVVFLAAVWAIPVEEAPCGGLPSLSPPLPRPGHDGAEPEDDGGAPLCPSAERERSKKESWLAEKAARRDVHVTEADLAAGLRFSARAAKATAGTKAAAGANGKPSSARAGRPPAARQTGAPVAMAPVGARALPVTTLFNNWTKEALPLVLGRRTDDQFHDFLRDHFTNQATRMDVRLIGILTDVAEHFAADRIEVVSGYRSPKYNLMLRKKGRQVARSSQHTEGNAVDFRIRGVPTPVLLQYVRSLRLGGVGYYPNSQFVHSDTGRVRFWKGS